MEIKEKEKRSSRKWTEQGSQEGEVSEGPEGKVRDGMVRGEGGAGNQVISSIGGALEKQKGRERGKERGTFP